MWICQVIPVGWMTYLRELHVDPLADLSGLNDLPAGAVCGSAR